MPVRAGLRHAQLVPPRNGPSCHGQQALETSAETEQAAQYNEPKTTRSEFPTRLFGTVRFPGQFFVVSG